MGSPSKKGWSPPSRSDFFSPGDIGSFKGLTPQQSTGGPPAIAVGSSSQQVLWLNDEGQEVEAPPGQYDLYLLMHVLP